MESLRLLEILQNPDPESVFRFIERVFGPLTEADGIPASVLAGHHMPEMLRHYYLRAGRKHLHRQNWFLTPESERPEWLEDDHAAARRGEKLPIYVENQGTFLWATAQDGDDPPIWVEGDDIEGWAVASNRLSEFLLRSILFELPFSAPAGAFTPLPIPPVERAALLERFVPITEFGPVDWYRFGILASDDLVVVADGAGFIWVCGADPAPIDQLGLGDRDWERGTR